ncbi:hypothetical protein EVAR_90506_1 [Eumeta japonica]|uniref:Uncharacterized protein n=1 Tax=Eumeta variegata TaxID=151549 RepID=A0A4C2AB71_EUMVA|nr:hypothetical protein EVAR_90506_1 [Eumeta japonica]
MDARRCPEWGPRPSDLSGNSAVRVPGSTPVGAHPINRVASAIGNLAVGAKSELESLKNINKEVKESVILKLLDINELALRLDESRSDMWWSWSGKKRGGPRNSRPRKSGSTR